MLWCVLISLWWFGGYGDADGGGYSEGGDGGDGCVGVDGYRL